METCQIGQFGERLVASWLSQNGYSGMQYTRLPGSTDIQADGKEKVLVQVKTAMHPNEPAYPSADEIRNIKSRAANLTRIAFVAQVQIDSNGNQKREISWSRP